MENEDDKVVLKRHDDEGLEPKKYPYEKAPREVVELATDIRKREVFVSVLELISDAETRNALRDAVENLLGGFTEHSLRVNQCRVAGVRQEDLIMAWNATEGTGAEASFGELFSQVNASGVDFYRDFQSLGQDYSLNVDRFYLEIADKLKAVLDRTDYMSDTWDPAYSLLDLGWFQKQFGDLKVWDRIREVLGENFGEMFGRVFDDDEEEEME